MKGKKIIRVLLFVLIAIVLVVAGFYIYANYWINHKFVPSKDVFTERVAFIDPNNTLLSENFETCDERHIFDYYNPERATYSEGKNGLRKFIHSNYQNKNYSDSGYLNFRFVINCKGETGRYVIVENDLQLQPYHFSEGIKKQLFELTTQLKKWNPNIIRDQAVDSYMYISYRIENGEIIEIIP